MTTDANRALCCTMLAVVWLGIVAVLVRGAAHLGAIGPLPPGYVRALPRIFVASVALPHAAWAIAQISSPVRGAVPIFRSTEDGWLIVLVSTLLCSTLAGASFFSPEGPDATHMLGFPLLLASLLFVFARFYHLKRTARSAGTRITAAPSFQSRDST